MSSPPLRHVNPATGVVVSDPNPVTNIADITVDQKIAYGGVPYNRIFIFGDSHSSTALTAGLNAGEPYASLLAAAYPGFTVTQSAVAGTGINGYWQNSLIAASLTSSDIVLGLCGFNTLRFFGPSPIFMEDYRIAMEAFYAWCAVPESFKVRVLNPTTGVRNPLVTSSGVWTEWTIAGGKQSEYTTANAASKTFTTTGDTVFVWYMRLAGQTGVMTITIDGIAYGIVTTNMSYTPDLTAVGSQQYEPALWRVSGLGSGPHTVVVASSNTGISLLMAAAGFDRASVLGATVLAGNCFRSNATGYAIVGVAANDPGPESGSTKFLMGDGGVSLFNVHHKRAVDALRAQGLLIREVDACGVYRPLEDVSSDNVHQSKYGHRSQFGLFRGEIEFCRDIRGR